MKKALLIAIVFISTYSSIGQIVLNQTDLPQIGDVQIYNSLDSTQSLTILPGTSGANQVWNFASLPADLDTINFVAPATTPNGSFFPGANIASGRNTKYQYYINGSSGQKIYGFDENQPTVLDIYPYEFPLLAYGASVNHKARARFKIVNSNTYDALYAELTSTADAWGTITTPAGTVNAIRINTSETVYDSSYVGGVGTQNSVTTGNYYYKWYVKNLGWPVLQIAKGIFADPDYKQVQYASNLSSVTGIENIESYNDTKIYPNPTSGKFVIDGKKISYIEIYNALGEKIYAITNLNQQTSNEVDLSKFQKGIYFVKIYNGTNVYNQKIVVQ